MVDMRDWITEEPPQVKDPMFAELATVREDKIFTLPCTADDLSIVADFIMETDPEVRALPPILNERPVMLPVAEIDEEIIKGISKSS